MKIKNEIKNMLDGINDSSDITEKNVSELEGIAKDYPKCNTERKEFTRWKGWYHWAMRQLQVT